MKPQAPTIAQMKKALAQFRKGTKVKERVYHGTGNLENLASFDPSMTGKGNDQLGSGFYFTTHPDEASGYATSVTPNVEEGTTKLGGNSSPGVVAAHLAIRKPIKIGPQGYGLNDSNVNLSHDQVKRIMEHNPKLRDPEKSPLNDHFDISRGVTSKMIHDVAGYYTGKGKLFMLENDMFKDDPTNYRRALHNVLGYDGVMKDFGDGRKHYVAWFPEQVKSAIGNRGTYDPTNPDITMAKGGSVEPKKTVKAYKLFRVHPDHPGKLFPLFVDANTPVEMGRWVDAKEGEMRNGKVKSKIGDLAYRPGWHAGDLPIATHIGEKSDPSLTAPDRRPANHAWAEVEMPNDVDWQSEATRRGTNAQGKVVPVKAHITDQIPVGGHYRYKTNPNMTGNWLIGGSMKVNRVLSDAEVNRINQAAGMSDLPRSTPFNKKRFGFAAGGVVAPAEWVAEEHINHMAGGGPVMMAAGGRQPSLDEMKLALNQHGMYSPLEKAAINVPRTKGTPAEFMAEISKQPGFRPEEVTDRKLMLPNEKLTKAEMLAYIRKHQPPQIREKVFGGEDYREDLDNIAKSILGDEYATYDDLDWRDQEMARHDVAMNWGYDPEPRHEDWQLPGGDNYREVLLKLPQKGLNERERNNLMLYEADMRRGKQLDPWHQKQYEALAARKDADKQDFHAHHHWDDPNVLAHLRLSDRTGPSGEKILHIEEIQSDWHQQGRKRGYMTGQDEPMDRLKAQRVKDKIFERFDSGEIDTQQRNELLDELSRRIESGNKVPEAPFKKSWHELALKHALGIAAKGKYHGIAITPGDVQEKRWEDPGLRVHYDKKLPDILNKIGKPHGAQVGTIDIKTPAEKEPTSNQDMADALGVPYEDFAQNLPKMQKQYWDMQKNKTTPVHYFPITDSLRQQINTEGQPMYKKGGMAHLAAGGQPSLAQMKAQLTNPSALKSVGVYEAIDITPKPYMPAVQSKGIPAPGGVATPSGMPIGGVDTNNMQPGQQLMPQIQPQPQQPQGGLPGTQPPQGMPGAPGQPPMGPQGNSNILQMTPQGQAMAAIRPNAPGQLPAKMAKGGTAKTPSVEQMKKELAENKDSTSKRMKIDAEGPGGVKGIVVPKHMWHGTAHAEGMKHLNEARAQVYGSENRDPLSIGKIGAIHKQTLAEHFKKPEEQQRADEQAALDRLRAAKHIGKTANTLDESEKLDTVRHEHDEKGRTYVGYASKGTAGHALYTSGHGENMKHHVINTCPGQTTGCGGGVDEHGIVDTKKGTCFAPNAESQYVNAAVRRAAHEQAKHDPAMTKDWILAHTGSLRHAAERADKKKQVTLFRPNVVDETDVSSRHVIRHLNEQRKAKGLPGIVANSYGKTNELHDPENGYHVTHSNVGPKVKKGQEISENIGRDKARVRNTILAADNRGDFTNEQGHKTPPKGSYMVTDVKRGSKLSKDMEKAITHAKYWSAGRPVHELSDEEREEGPEAHYSGSGRKTTEDKAHYGHKTIGGERFDYQRQHILHPRLVQVGKNEDGSPHMIPTDSRFKDTDYLPKNRYKTKNGKEAGHILMTTPTESTSNLGHETSFTHHVSPKHIEHALKNNGEYEIDKPEDQIKARGKEYAAPQPVKFMAEGGHVGRHPGFGHDEFHAFPEQNPIAQRHLAMRRGDDESRNESRRTKKPVVIHKNLDTMRLELSKGTK